MPKETYYYLCKIGNKIYYPKYGINSNYDFITLYGIIEKGRIIKFSIPIDSNNITLIIRFYISYMDSEIEIFSSLGYFTHIPPIYDGYYISENFILKFINNRFYIYTYNKTLEMEFEKKFCQQLKKETRIIL